MKNRYPLLNFIFLSAVFIFCLHQPTAHASATKTDGTSDVEQKKSPILVPPAPTQNTNDGQEKGGGITDEAFIREVLRELATNFQDYPATTYVTQDEEDKTITIAIDASKFSKIVNNPKFSVNPSTTQLTVPAKSPKGVLYDKPVDFRNTPDDKEPLLEFMPDKWETATSWLRQRILIHELCGLALIKDPHFKTTEMLHGWLLQHAYHSIKNSELHFFDNQKVTVVLTQSNIRSLLGTLNGKLRDIPSIPTKSAKDLARFIKITERKTPNTDSNSDPALINDQLDTVSFSQLDWSKETKEKPAVLQGGLAITLSPVNNGSASGDDAGKLQADDVVKMTLEINKNELVSFNILKAVGGAYDALKFKGTAAKTLYAILTTIGANEDPAYKDPFSNNAALARRLDITIGLNKVTGHFGSMIECLSYNSPQPKTDKDNYACSLVFSN